MASAQAVQCATCHVILPKDHPYGWCPTCGSKLTHDVLCALGHPARRPSIALRVLFNVRVRSVNTSTLAY
jgi:predicted amidophosphoribosyltransferase